MGRLILPIPGFVYADAQIAIYSTDGHPIYAPLCLPLWKNSDITVVSSNLTLAETLVEPNRTKNTELSERRENLWNQPNTGLLPISKDILRMAAKLRAETPGLKLPDAIHASASLYYGCILFITNDLGFKRIPSLPLILLDQVLASPDY